MVLPVALEVLLSALGALSGPDMPNIAVIGGTGVNIRLSTTADPHRATPDIDIVADDQDPPPSKSSPATTTNPASTP